MKYPALVLVFILAASAAWADVRTDGPIVKEIHFTAYQMRDGKLSTHPETDYCLYYRDKETRRIDAAATTTMSLLLVHPAPQVAARLASRAKKDWYVSFTDSVQGISDHAPLLSKDNWKAIPAPLQNILIGLGIDDSDLILIACDLHAGSTSVYYHPRHDKDRAFYAGRLKALKAYLVTHDIGKAVSLEMVAPE
jgi:hypothetical protein